MPYPMVPYRDPRARRGPADQRVDPVADLKLNEAGGYEKAAAALPPGSAVAEMLSADQAEDFANRPFGGAEGAMLPSPPPPVVTELEATELPPPPWAGQVASPSLAREVPPPDPPSALSVMKHAAGDVEEPGAFAPPLVTKPLERPAPPPADWEQELQERQEAGDDELQAVVPHPPWKRGAP